MKRLLPLIATLFAIACCAAQNLRKVPLADPFILLYDGVYYAYGTGAGSGIEVWTSRDLSTWERAKGNARDGLALHRTERGEIILAQQTLRSPMHPFSVQRFVKMGYPFTQYRRAQPMIVDDVAITASRGAKSGMKIIRYSFNPTHGDVTR